MPKLTELEAVILGVVARDGPVTSYAIAQEFADSPTSRWSGSAGAIYPAMSRLHKRGLVADEAGKRGRRQHKTYTVTTTGKAELRAWIRPPFPDGVGGATEDPIRSRLLFLSLLSPTARQAFLESALERVQAELSRVDEMLAEGIAADEAWQVIALEGCQAELQARIQWLTRVMHRLAESS